VKIWNFEDNRHQK